MTAPITVLLKGIACTLTLTSPYEASAPVPVFPFQLVGTSETVMFQYDHQTSYRRETDTTIVCDDEVIPFTDSATCGFVWSAISVLLSPQAATFIPLPSIDRVEWIATYLTSAHPILRHLIICNVTRDGFLHALYELFAIAEITQQFPVLHACYKIMMALFHLESPAVLSLLLHPTNIYHTIACLEYANPHSTSYYTTHRCYLDHTVLQCPVSALHSRIEPFARTHYAISYVKKAIFGPMYVSPAFDDAITQQNHSLLHSLFSDRTFAKQIVQALVPMMISVNERLMYVAKPNCHVLRFLNELFSLRVSDSAMNSLLRKLQKVDLFTLLDYLFVTPHSVQASIMELWLTLAHHAPTHTLTHFSQPNSLANVINRLASLDPIEEIDLSIEFLQHPVLEPLVTAVIPTALPLLMNRVQQITCFEKQSKLYPLIGWLFQKHPDPVYMEDGMSLFIQQSGRMVATPTPQKKLLALTCANILTHAISNPDCTRAILRREGMIESILCILLANARDNLLSSTLHGAIHMMVRQWLGAFLDAHPIPRHTVIQTFQTLTHVVLDGVRMVCDPQSPAMVPERRMPLIRYDSVEAIQKTRSPDTLKQELGMQRMMHVVSNHLQRVRRQAWNRWKTPMVEPNTFLTDAIYRLVAERKQFYQKTIYYSLQVSLAPIIQRVQLRGAFQQWKKHHAAEKERIAHQLKEYIELYHQNMKQTYELESVITVDSRSSGQITRVPSYSDVRPLLHRNSSIGEVLCEERRDDDHFYTIPEIRKDGMPFLSIIM